MKNPIARTMIVFALGAPALGLAGCSIGVGASTDTAPGSVETDLSSITVGDCFNASLGMGAPSSVAVIDCAELHDYEVYQSVILDEGEFPGDEQVEAAAEDACGAAFEEFIGISYANSVLLVNYFYPSAVNWAAGDREVVCVVQDVDAGGEGQQVSGSLRGLAR